MQYKVQTLSKIPRRWGTMVYSHTQSIRKVRSDWKYPFAMMAIGESFCVRLRHRKRVETATYRYRRNRANWKAFTVRKISATRCRCWRIQ